MTKYRICPFGCDKWKVQRRGRFLWSDVGRLHHDIMFTMTHEFDSEAEAEAWIDERLKADRERERERLVTARRRREIAPRGHP